MNTKQRIGLAIGGGIIAVAAAVGVGAVAANLANGGDQAGPAGYGQRPGGAAGNRDGQRFDTTALATQLAAKLGVDESKMKVALDNAFQANRPTGVPSGGFGGTPGARPSGSPPSDGPGGGFDRSNGGRNERLTAMATSIAKELNLDESQVLAALQEVMSSMRPGQASGQPSVEPTS